MLDRLTEEQIGAYIDGELHGDELELVERQLAESEEHQQLLQELIELRSQLRALPKSSLPADFADRVVTTIQRQSPPQVPSRSSHSWAWRHRALQAAVVAASLLVLAITLSSLPWGGKSSPLEKLPIQRVALPPFLVEQPKYVVVYDVSITPKGQENRTLPVLLHGLGIGMDPNFRLDAKLETELLAVRQTNEQKQEVGVVPYKQGGAPRSGDQDQVELIYVAAMAGALDQFGRQLEQLEMAGDEVSNMQYDLVLEPQRLAVLRQLHTSAREHFAKASNLPEASDGYAFKLVFRTKLTSASIPGLATFPGIQLTPEFLPSGTVTSEGSVQSVEQTLVPPGGANAFAPPPAEQAERAAANEVGHILLILRNVAGEPGK